MTDEPLCEVCSSRPATLVIMRRRKDYSDRTYVCPECAGERAGALGGPRLDFERIIARVAGKPTTGEKAAFSCALCGTTLADIIVDGRPGCCMCYSRFPAELDEAIKAAQGPTGHIGKGPGE